MRVFGMTMLLWTLAACGASGTNSEAQDTAAQNGNAVAQGGNTEAPGGIASAQNSNAAAAPSPLACPGDANDSYASVRIACVQAINDYRATLNLPAFSRWCGTAACIDQQTASDGTAQRAHSAFGDCNEYAQNECPGWSTPVAGSLSRCLAQMWGEGPGTDFAGHGHYINMTSRSYTRVECGVTVTGNSFWAAMDFR